MQKLVKTRTGSNYIIDTVAKTWQRATKTDGSGKIRSEQGTYNHLACLMVGREMVLECPPFDAAVRDVPRVLITSTVLEITEG